MFIFPKKDIIPIIVPQLCFRDKYNHVNSYVEMNPSLFINENGDVTIFVRCVNYKKFRSKDFTIYGNMSHSIYCKLIGKLHATDKLNIEDFEYDIVNFNYNLPVYPAYWKGMEDIRFINESELLINIPELHIGGKPTIFKADFINDQISNFVHCQPNTIDEKNWMPYHDNSDNKVIYSLSPFQIKSIENNDLQEISIDELIKTKLNGYHGSSNGIKLNEFERLFLIHKNEEVITHRWLIFNTKTNSVLLSDNFVFFKNSYIEFTCSLAKYNDRIFVSLGVNDDKAYIIEVSNEDIMNSFKLYENKSKYPTIVTMLYDIRAIENNIDEKKRKFYRYIDCAKKFLLKLPFPIIFFIDDNEETYNAIYNTRQEHNLLDKTFIYKCDLKTTYFYKYLSRLEELQKTFLIENINLTHETPLYIVLNNNKFHFIDKAIELNIFNSTHFIWMDFGINHIALNTERIFEWIDKVPDKIKQLCTSPYTEPLPPKKYLNYIYHNIAGGLFSGSIENMKKYSELFKNKTEEIYNDDWYQIDEAVMTMVHKDNPDLFDLFYGDYDGIVSNYLSPINSIECIIAASQKYIYYNNNIEDKQKCYSVLCFCIPYFQNNLHDKYIEWFIECHIKVNYDVNNGKLLDSIIKIINSLSEINYNQMLHFLSKNMNNIKIYENQDVILGKFESLKNV